MRIFLDDIRNPEDVYPKDTSWKVCRSYEEVVVHLYCGQVTELSLDNDLGVNSTDAKEGRHVLDVLDILVLVDGYPVPVVRVHSANPVARRTMVDAYEALKRRARMVGLRILEDEQKG